MTARALNRVLLATLIAFAGLSAGPQIAAQEAQPDAEQSQEPDAAQAQAAEPPNSIASTASWIMVPASGATMWQPNTRSVAFSARIFTKPSV